jgi:predicted TIM-barrel fold metal-dependent hydrolase
MPEEGEASPNAARRRSLACVFDAHFHVFAADAPLPGHDGFIPERFEVADYRARVAALGVTGGAVVAASTQGHDAAPLIAAAESLGPGFVVVARADPAQDDAALAALAARRVRGLRYLLHRGDAWTIPALLAHARRAAGHGLHAELYADAATLGSHIDALATLPAASLDHLGLTAAGLPVTLDLARAGFRVKATGFGRVALDVARALEALAAIPGCLMAATDLPSTRARRPFEDADLALLRRVAGEAALGENARRFYRM